MPVEQIYLKSKNSTFSQGLQYRIESLRQTVITCIRVPLEDGVTGFYNGYGERLLRGTDCTVANRFSTSYMHFNQTKFQKLKQSNARKGMQ